MKITKSFKEFAKLGNNFIKDMQLAGIKKDDEMKLLKYLHKSFELGYEMKKELEDDEEK